MDKTEIIINILIKALMIFTVFPIREYARNSMAVRFGDDTPKIEGKLTLNPFAHLDPMGCLFMLLTGFGWGNGASINPANFKSKNPKVSHIMVALAGPFANMFIALIMVVLYKLLFKFGVASVILYTVIYIIIQLNLNLAVFHLLPVPGFDGGTILMMFLPPKAAMWMIRYRQYIFFAFIILIFAGSGAGMIGFITSYIFKFMDFITSFLGYML